MLNNQGADQKHNCVLTLDGTTGVKGLLEFPCHIETRLRTIVTGVGALNTVLIQGRIIGSNTWTTITTITGPNAGTVSDISTYDFIRYNVGVANGTGEAVSSAFLSFI